MQSIFDNIYAGKIHAVRSALKGLAKGVLSQRTAYYRNGKLQLGTLLDVAVRANQEDIMEMLINEFKVPVPANILNVWRSDMNTNPNIAQILMKFGANPNVMDEHQVPLLNDAVINGDSEIVEMLLLRGANPNLQDSEGNSALHEAFMADDRANIELLLRYGGNLELENENEDSPLDIADEDQLEFLRGLGIEIEIENEQGEDAIGAGAEEEEEVPPPPQQEDPSAPPPVQKEESENPSGGKRKKSATKKRVHRTSRKSTKKSRKTRRTKKHY